MIDTNTDLSSRFFYVNQSSTSAADSARMFPMSRLIAMNMVATNDLRVIFDDSGVGDHTVVQVLITADKGKEAIKDIVGAINSNQKIVMLADQFTGESVISDYTGGSVSIDTGSTGTFSLNGALTVAKAATFNGGIKRFVSLTATGAISANDSGIPHLVGPAAAGLAAEATFTLPTAADGLYYKFIYAGGGEDDVDFIISTGSDTNFFIGGISHNDSNTDDTNGVPDVITSNNSSNSKLTVKVPQTPTRIDVFCDATNWFVSGSIITTNSTGAVFADQS